MKKNLKYIIEVNENRSKVIKYWKSRHEGTAENFKYAFVYSKSFLDEVSDNNVPKQLTLDLIFEKFPIISHLTNGGKCHKNVKLSFKLTTKTNSSGESIKVIEFKVKRLNGKESSFSIDAVAYTFCDEFTQWIEYNGGKVSWYQE